MTYDAIWDLSLLVIGAGLALAFIRLVVGPTLPDRVVALDLMAVLSVGYICAFSIKTDEVVFLEVAVALALITFLGTVAFARYLERRGHE